MIRIFTGDDRISANRTIQQILGSDYEVIEGADLTPADLPSITKGASLFADKRQILIRDLSTNKATFAELSNYLDTPHNIIILESKLDKRTAAYKTLKGQVEIQEFSLPPDPNLKLVFNIYTTAKHNGPKAINMLDKIQQHEDPVKFSGLLVSQALKDYRVRQGTKEKKALKELSILDLNLKTTSYQPWLLIRSFLLRLSSL